MQSVNQDIMNYTCAICNDFMDRQSVNPTFWITDMQSVRITDMKSVRITDMESVMILQVWNL